MKFASVNHVPSTVDVIHHSTETQDLGVLCASSTGGTSASLTVCAFKLTNGSPTMSRTTRKIPFHMLSNIINLIHIELFLIPHFICFCVKGKIQQITIMLHPKVTTILKPLLHWFFVNVLKLHLNFVHEYMIA